MSGFSLSTIVFLVIVASEFHQSSAMRMIKEEKQPNTLMKLCGENFLRAWKLECLAKVKAFPRSRRSINAFSKQKDVLILPEKSAKAFFRRLSRKRRSFMDGDRDTALEECCMEGCTLEEVAEYPC